MRINVYDEELTDEFEFEFVEVPETGNTYCGFRMFLKTHPDLHHTSVDDDRTAITIWFGTKALALNFLRKAFVAAIREVLIS